MHRLVQQAGVICCGLVGIGGVAALLLSGTDEASPTPSIAPVEAVSAPTAPAITAAPPAAQAATNRATPRAARRPAPPAEPEQVSPDALAQLLARARRDPSDPATLAAASDLVRRALTGGSGGWSRLLVRLARDPGPKLLAAALASPHANPLLRRFAAVHLAWMLPAPEALDVYAQRLSEESDPRLLGHMARALAQHHRGRALPLIEKTFHATQDPRARLGLVEAVFHTTGREAWQTLKTLSQIETQPALRKLAADRLARRTGPVDGLRITRVAPTSQAASLGWRDGDILVRLDGAPLTSSADLAAQIADGKGDVQAEVYRDGRLERYRVDPRALGVSGTYVFAG